MRATKERTDFMDFTPSLAGPRRRHTFRRYRRRSESPLERPGGGLGIPAFESSRPGVSHGWQDSQRCTDDHPARTENLWVIVPVPVIGAGGLGRGGLGGGSRWGRGQAAAVTRAAGPGRLGMIIVIIARRRVDSDADSESDSVDPEVRAAAPGNRSGPGEGRRRRDLVKRD